MLSSQVATVLVVDADVAFREFEARTLIDQGYTVLKAGSKEEALRFARQNANIALLVLGTPLQQPDRLELTYVFQQAHPGAPVLLVLESFEEFDERFHIKGRLGVMAKPFELSELIDQVRRLVAEVHESSVENPSSQASSPAVSPHRLRTNGKEARLAPSCARGLFQDAKRI